MGRKIPYFKLTDYIIIAMLASMGIAIKTIIVPLAQIITGPLFIPGGVIAGGFYMAFLVLGEAVTKKYGTATLIALTQGVVVAVTGTMGSHGAVSIFTYALPGLAIDLVYFIIRHKACCPICSFIGGAVANIVGSFAVNLAIFNLPFVPLMLSMCAAALSGGLGGLVAYSIAVNLDKLGILGNTNKKQNESDDCCSDSKHQPNRNNNKKKKKNKNGSFIEMPDDIEDK